MNGEIIAALTAEHQRVARELHGISKALKALRTYNDAPKPMSAAGRKRISIAQKKRWAKVKR